MSAPGGLVMARRGDAGRLLADLNAEHAPTTPEETIEPVTNVTTLQRSNEGTNVDSNEEKVEPSNEVPPQRTKIVTNKASTVRAPKATAQRPIERSVASAVTNDERQARLDKAMQIATEDEETGDIAVVTIRVSARLAAYMDKYVSRLTQIGSKKKFRKQDAVAAAFATFYADHPMPPAPIEEEL